MIDLHCHLLPGIDDGARDAADSVEMARIAAADGITRICATPHIRDDHDVRIDELAGRVEALSAELRERSVPVDVLPGGEVAEQVVARLDDDELEAVSLGLGGGWILLEPHAGPLSDSLERAVLELRERGLRSVIAHPERHLTVDLVPRLVRLAGAGALIQATAESLVEPASAAAMLELAALGVIHVLGSDAHSSRFGRPPRLAAAFARLVTVEPCRSAIDWMAVEAPAAIVRGDQVEPPYPARSST